ncbi:RE1 [Symbiodinium sp. CCMP2592]|nr:RE1 [Symbiodinium sp. CCMP2592]
MTRPGTVFALAAIDIKDAYLEVPQVEPVLADLPRDYSGSGRYIFLRCIPGQRDGAQRWFDFYVNFLHEGLTLETCTVSPAVMKTKEGPLMLHVDDNLVLCPLTWLHDTLVPLIKSRFQATVEIAYRVGDQISFLKRVHTLTETGMKIAISDQYARSMAKILEIRGGTAQTPDLAEFSGHDTSQVLSEQQASKYRSVIGIALYISADRPDIAHSVRKLSAVMTRPTALAWRAAIRLTQYMLATSSYALHLEPGEPGTSMLHGCVSAGSDLVECFTDADWSGSTARPIASQLDQPPIASMVRWFTLPRGLNDQCAAKQAKHIAGRLLWIQDYVKRQVFKVMPVSSAYNLGDIGTKALAKARLRSLMYMHNFIDASSDERIGKFEYEQMQQQEYVKAQIKRVKKSVNTSTKLHSNIFMVMCNLMPLLTDATKLSAPTVSGGYASYMFPLCMVLLVALFAARALGLNDFSTLRLSIDFQYAPQALDVNGYVMQCFAFAFMLIGFMQGVSAEQYASLALMITCGALWNENRKLSRVLENPAALVVQVPEEVFVTTRGVCFHKGGECAECRLVVRLMAMPRLITFLSDWGVRRRSIVFAIDRCGDVTTSPFGFAGRENKVVTLSSGEAELVALTQVVSEAVLIKKAWAFIVDGEDVMPLDPDVIAAKELRVLAILTDTNPADAGTKVLAGNRIKVLCGIMGMVDSGGNRLANGTDERNNIPNHTRTFYDILVTLVYAIRIFLDTSYAVGYIMAMFGGDCLYVFGGLAVTGALCYAAILGTRWRLTLEVGNQAASLQQPTEHSASEKTYEDYAEDLTGYEVDAETEENHADDAEIKENHTKDAETQNHTKDAESRIFT